MPHLPLVLPLVIAFALFVALIFFFSVKMFRRFFCCGVCRVSDDVEVGTRVADESQAAQAAPPGDDPKAGAIGVRRFQWPEIETFTATFTSPVVGQGGSSTVYLARLPPLAGQSSPAIGAVKVHRPSERLHRAFRQELDVLVHLRRHPHIVLFLGYCDEREEGALVFEFVSNGSLHEKLHGGNGAILPWSRRMVIAYKLAQALDYLHEGCDLQIIHGDIKASNILLGEELEPKLCDFGSARMGFSAAVRPAHPMMGSPGYVDPHYLRSGLASKKNDVYSFGVLLLELVTGKEAFCSEKEQMLTAAVGPALKDPATGAAELVDPRLGGEYNAVEAAAVAAVAASCIGLNPTLRPSIAEVVRIIGEKVSSSISAVSSESDGKSAL